MTIKHLETATCYFLNSDTQRSFPSVREARDAAERYVGNTVAVKPFPLEETYLYGPGDGSCSVTVRQDIDMAAMMKS